MSTVMQTGNSWITGEFLAECPRCHFVCAYWDDEDLDGEGNLLCDCDEPKPDWPRSTCIHCGRTIFYDPRDGWVDPEATGDDAIWRETCDEHDTFTAEHEPEDNDG